MLGSCINNMFFHCDCCWKLKFGVQFQESSHLSTLADFFFFYLFLGHLRTEWSVKIPQKHAAYLLCLRVHCLFLELPVNSKLQCEGYAAFPAFLISLYSSYESSSPDLSVSSLVTLFWWHWHCCLGFPPRLSPVSLMTFTMRIRTYLTIATALRNLWGLCHLVVYSGCWWSVTTLWWR